MHPDTNVGGLLAAPELRAIGIVIGVVIEVVIGFVIQASPPIHWTIGVSFSVGSAQLLCMSMHRRTLVL